MRQKNTKNIQQIRKIKNIRKRPITKTGKRRRNYGKETKGKSFKGLNKKMQTNQEQRKK